MPNRDRFRCHFALETAKRNGLEPHAWLTDVLARLPEWPEERLAELLPLEGFTFTG
ncbi:transposase domain-containing protein, partial [Escherichia coli]|nr:transposase domain-containing protein [Escherichia coli]